MCGVAGIVALAGWASPPSRVELARMAAALHHRGPDDRGVHREGPAGLAHTRLSIIDLAGGRQPMSLDEDGLVVSYNGEVFNYVELRDDLTLLGRRFRTASDTEVVLQAWAEWGEGALSRFDGQFALAIWDRRKRELTLARDRFGVRPLYACVHAGRLYFASEVRAIFAADASIPRALDPRGLDETFTFWTVVPPRSVFAGVTEIPPGHTRTYSVHDGNVRERAWFTLDLPARGQAPFTGDVEEAAGAVREALERAVRLRMLRADVPVGAYLSGGLDSSLVAALAQRATPRFSTYSIRFQDAEYDETRYQRLVARELGTDHHEVMVTRDDIARVFPDVVLHAERPVLRTAPAPLFLLSKLVRDSGIEVVLTGEGADELFAGYDLFREGRVRRFWARQPHSEQRPRLLERLYPYLARSPVAQRAMARRFFGRALDRAGRPGFAHGPRWLATGAVKRLFHPALHAELAGFDAEAELLADLPSAFATWSPLAQDQWLEIRTLLSGYLLSAQGDRVLMAHSVEGRFPFLDVEVADLACRLPDAHKLRVLDEKHVLKRVARPLLPAEVIARTKQPYRAPDAVAFLGPAGRAYAPELLEPGAVARAGVFDPDAVSRLWRKVSSQQGDASLSNTDNMALVGILSTQILHERLVRRAPEPHGLRDLAFVSHVAEVPA